MRTLLLSANYFPLKTIPWDRAVKMRYEGTVDVVAEYQDECSSPSVTWRIPAVVRSRRFVKPQRGVRFSPANVFLRDGYRCQYCGGKFKELECDHVVPKSHGGQKTWTNVVASCRACNAKKADMDCDTAGMFPINKPVTPASLPRPVLNIDRETAPVEWLDWLPV